jgi:small subunit ribosomal protein S14
MQEKDTLKGYKEKDLQVAQSMSVGKDSSKKKIKSSTDVGKKSNIYKGDFQRLNRRNMWFRNEKRKELIAKYADKRARLKAAGDYDGLDKLPHNACPVRARNLCVLTGRARGVLRYFNVCRAQFRKLAHAGELPGVKKYSW